MKRYFIFSLILALTMTWAYSQSLPKCQAENCQVCSTSGICVMCRPNHILEINKSTHALECIQKACKIENCFRCISDSICAQCEAGFSLTAFGSCSIGTQQAIKQQIVDKICLRSQSSGQCNECASGFVLRQGKCFLKTISLAVTGTACTPTTPQSNQGCTGCLTPNFCTSCNSNITTLFANALGQCAAGISCNQANGNTPAVIPNCLTCSSATTCQVCQNGYTQIGGQCLQCNIPGCQICGANNSCTTCYSGYTNQTTINNTVTCVLSTCPYPCATCDTNGNCLTCVSPFTNTPFDNGTCFTCSIANCAYCSPNTPTLCQTCFAGYNPNQANTACNLICTSPYCILCTAGPNICTACIPGYTPNGGICSVCQNSPICITCSSNNLANCTICMAGYYVNTNGANQVCSPCAISTCKTCTNNGTVCTQYISSTGLLAYSSATLTNTYFPYICDPGCATCSQNYPGNCLQCSNGYYALVNNNVIQCLPCGANCLTCNPSSITTCYTCYSNSFLSGTSCVSCNPNSNCLTCSVNNPTSCTSCPYGYYMTSVATNAATVNYCVNSCPGNCLTCSIRTVNKITSAFCTSCQQGYGLTITGNCLPCLANCRVCSGSFQNVCLQCGQGFYLNSNYQCTPCSVACTSCTPLGCTTCAAGFNLVTSGSTSVCSVVCNFPCASCLNNQPNSCTSCLMGYTYNSNSNSCTMSTTCVTSNTNSCEYCPLGSILVNGACQACSSNCWRCSSTDGSQCTACPNGYYLSGTTCTACPTGCQTCTSSTTCSTCASGYTQAAVSVASNQVMCVACIVPCAQCYLTPQTCVTCIAGFNFNGWNCVSNFYYTFTATLNVNNQGFFNNYQAFISRLTYALQTQNNKAISVQSINTTSGSQTNINVYMTTLQASGSRGSYDQYSNVQFALIQNADGQIAGMPVASSTLGYQGGEMVSYYSNTPRLCGILIPLSILIVVILGYFYCSRNDMDFPGSVYYPPLAPESQIGQSTQMKAL